jgi:hypothetical protein
MSSSSPSSNTTIEATKKWQAESLVKRVLEVTQTSSASLETNNNIIPLDAAPQICALSYDLNCEIEFEEALSTLLSSKERQIQRTCANGFADFALQVDSCLEFSTKIEKTKKMITSTSLQVNQMLNSKIKLQDSITETELSLKECTHVQKQLQLCMKWMKMKQSIENLTLQKDYLQAINQVNGLTDELRLYPSSNFAFKLSQQLITKEQILKRSEQELQQWMVYALDQGRELGFSKLDRDDIAIHSLVNVGGGVVHVDKNPVARFFAIHRKDYAEEFYSTQRSPALKQTLSALTRASTITTLTERVVRIRNCLCEICGFFLIEKSIQALSKGELAEIWLDCSNRLLESLRIGYPSPSTPSSSTSEDLEQKESQECAEILACDVARCCIQIELQPPPQLLEFFKSRLGLIKQGWIYRSYSIIRDYASSKQNKVIPSDAPDELLPFCTKTKQEITRAVYDALVLEKFLGSFRLFSNAQSTVEQICEKEVVSRVLREALGGTDKPPSSISQATEQKPLSASSLEESLFVYRAAREMAIFSSSLEGRETKQSRRNGGETYAEIEQLAREKIQKEFVTSKIDKFIRFEQSEFLPVLNATTKIEPHQCVMDCLYDVEKSFSSSTALAELAAIPREVRASLLAETMGRLAELLETWILNKAQFINPIALKQFSLDLHQIEQFFPDQSDRFSPLLQILLPFCVEGQQGNNSALEMALEDSTRLDRERYIAILTKFKEMDSSSRLFGPAHLKKRIFDFREHDAKRYLLQLKAKTEDSNDSDLL